ncbi:ligand-binding sensor domain-containing protein [Spirosoma arcticum]
MKRLAVLIMGVLSLCAGTGFAQGQKPDFTHLTTNEGLSQSTVLSILKDSKGFMWFGTNEGLNKYDGYEFSIYKHYPNDQTSLRNNIINDILEDNQGTIWVATSAGLDLFNRSTNSFSHYSLTPFQLIIYDIFQDSKQRIWLGTASGLYLVDVKTNTFSSYRSKKTSTTLSNDVVLKITEDKAGILWVGTQNGLNRFNPKSGNFSHFFHNPKDAGSIASNWVRAVYIDQNQTLWIGTLGGGIARYNPVTNSFTNFLHNTKIPASLGHNDIFCLTEDNQNNLWVGTENGGISIYDTKRNEFTTVVTDPANPNSLNSNSIYSLYKDNIGNIWAGTYSGGVNYVPKFGKKFRLYRNMLNENSLSNNIVLSIKGDDDGNIWIGTDGGGLNLFNPKTSRFSTYKNRPSVSNSPGSDYLITIVNSGENLLALGYHRKGFDLFNTKKMSFTHYVPLEGNTNDLPTASVNVLCSDRETNLWVGTWARGLYFYDRRSKQATRFLHDNNDPNTLCDNHLNAIYEDDDRDIWLGTENGLDMLDRTTYRFVHYTHNPENSRTIGSNTINCVLGAGVNKLWIGTTGGLCLLNKKTKQVSVITEKEGLPNNVINALIYDLSGNLWMSTNKGISNYNPRTKMIRNYGLLDGLQGNEFKVGSVFRAADGMLLFGGSSGFNTVYPERMLNNTYVPPVHITDFQVFNKSIQTGDADSILTKHISETSALSLKHDQNVFSVEFAALNYTFPEKNQYAYMLQGFDDNWNYVGNKRSATYTNLDPGTYTFRVKASNNDGLWNETGTSIQINVLPPFWHTWWFKLLLVSLVIGSAYAFYEARTSVLRSQKWALERVLEERTERLHQEQVLNKMKSQFVSTASHEFRTPLATIQSSVNLVGMYIDLPPERGKLQIQKHLTVVEKEIGKFVSLLDDILAIEKMSAGKQLFSPEPVNPLTIAHEVVSTYFQSRPDQRSVDLSTTGTPRSVRLDEKLIAQVLINLLSNAFKFSSTNPALHVDFNEASLVLSVIDHGIGIPEKDLPHLFETFFRAGNAVAVQGTGLGLFIIKQSVELHGGTVRVQSKENVGTTFTVTLPAAPCN